jgi:ribose transport system ATP-binding protein
MLASAAQGPLLEATAMVKSFPGVRALRGVNATFSPGEVVAVVGENGAGKSTLMKIIAGVHAPDDGEIRVDGEKVVIDSVESATDRGIAFIHQELNLADNLSIGANVYLGREPVRWGPLRCIDHGKIHRDTAEPLKQLGLDLPPTTLVRDLSIGQQQMVEIAKALSLKARMLIMDEPTSSLTQHEVDRLFEVIRHLRGAGVCIVYISHRLAEVKEIADRVTVLRDGCNSGDLAKEEIEHDRMVSLMVGRDVSRLYSHRGSPKRDVRLEVCDLRVPGNEDKAIHFEVHAGEIVALAGLVGAGRTELCRALFGIDGAVKADVRVDGKTVKIREPRDAIRAGIVLVPEDRKQQGLVLEFGVKHNTVLAGLDRYQRGGFLRKRQLATVAREMVERLNIKTPSIEQEVQLLSGGNQQKVVLAKWLSLDPKVLLLDEPTRGIDVMAKDEIYRLMEQMAQEGVAILMISSEMEEVLRMSDRVLVMHEGALAGSLQREEISEEAIMNLATGSDG